MLELNSQKMRTLASGKSILKEGIVDVQIESWMDRSIIDKIVDSTATHGSLLDLTEWK